MNATICPFCGLPTDVPHNTQEGCIAALHEEIARTRLILQRTHSSGDERREQPSATTVESEVETEPSL